jgi:putative transcriptional regulator
MELGSWMVDNMDANYLFKIKPQALWKKVLQNKGDAFSVIAQMPDSASWN